MALIPAMCLPFSRLVNRSLTKPIVQLRKATRQFAGGALATRVGSILEMRKDEIADLGWDFDTMAERIEALVSAQQRLLRDISHELRSPLSTIHEQLAYVLSTSASHVSPDDQHILARAKEKTKGLISLISDLLDNAIRFSPDGSTVEIETAAASGDVSLAIQDHGKGIARAYLSSLFTGFSDSDAPHHTKGTGLSLAIAQRIVSPRRKGTSSSSLAG